MRTHVKLKQKKNKHKNINECHVSLNEIGQIGKAQGQHLRFERAKPKRMIVKVSLCDSDNVESFSNI